jgi:uncharacterized protein (TIGR02246 family)
MGARDPRDLSRLFAERANRGDLGGLAELYEPEAKLIAADGSEAAGRAAIRKSLEGLLALAPRITPGDGRAVRAGDLALMSSRWRMTFAASDDAASLEGISTEIARCQADGSWLYLIDDPSSATLDR